MVKTINGNTYNFGKHRITKKYVIHKVVNFEWEKIAEFDTLEEMKKWAKAEQKKADKKEYRKMISDICGTSYSAACRDMGINRI